MCMNVNGGIKVVFFDLGKVLLNFSHENIIERLLTHTRPEDRRPGELFRFLFDMERGLCNLYDEGNISSLDFYAGIDRRFGLGVDFEGFAGLWNGIFTEAAEVSALARQVMKKKPVYLLSNVNELHWEFVRGRFPVLSEMRGHILSYEIRAKKPSPVIYGAAMRAAGVGPGESVFIDDLPENAAAASARGIKGVTFKDAESLEAELARLGLLG